MSVYEIITDQVIARLKAGTVPWRKPWNEVSVPRSMSTGKPYRGLNVFLLMASGFDVSPWWGTKNQILSRGGRIDRDQMKDYTVVIYWKLIDSETRQADGSLVKKKVPLLRYYKVWNLSQTSNVKFTNGEKKLTETELSEEDSNAKAEQLIKGWKTGPRVRHDSKDGAFWDSTTDTVHLPKRASFKSLSGYYATRFHEMGHASGTKDRLDRHTAADQFVFASHAYGREELTAEMTAAFLAGETGILPDVEENTAAYLRSWIATIGEDDHAVVVAAREAQKAADLITGKVKEEVTA